MARPHFTDLDKAFILHILDELNKRHPYGCREVGFDGWWVIPCYSNTTVTAIGVRVGEIKVDRLPDVYEVNIEAWNGVITLSNWDEDAGSYTILEEIDMRNPSVNSMLIADRVETILRNRQCSQHA